MQYACGAYMMNNAKCSSQYQPSKISTDNFFRGTQVNNEPKREKTSEEGQCYIRPLTLADLQELGYKTTPKRYSGSYNPPDSTEKSGAQRKTDKGKKSENVGLNFAGGQKRKSMYVSSNYNKHLKGLGDFGQLKMRRNSEFFLTFETSDSGHAKHLFECIKNRFHGQILIACKYSDGRADYNLVHLYYKNEKIKFTSQDFKRKLEEISGLECLEIKKVITQASLLKTMTPPGCPVVFKSKIPNVCLGGAKTQAPKKPASTSSPKPKVNISGLTGAPSNQQPIPKTKTFQAQAEEMNPHKAMLVELEAQVRSLERSLEEARTECEKTRAKWNQWNTNCMELLKETEIKLQQGIASLI